MSSISGRLPSVTIEYESSGQRVRKVFTDAHASRRFYVAKTREGKDPHVVSTFPKPMKVITSSQE